MTRIEWMEATSFVPEIGYDKVENAGDHWRIWTDGYRFSIFANGIVCHGPKRDSEEATALINACDEWIPVRKPTAFKNNGITVYPSNELPHDKGGLMGMVELVLASYVAAGINPYVKAKEKYSRSIEETNYYMDVVKKIKLGMSLKDDSFFDRGFLGYDKVDSFITVGKSVVRSANYREHVVPCDYLTNAAIEMIEAGAKEAEVARMIKANLIIVIIDTQEALRLDFEYGLKTSMPEGWKIGDDPLERLYVAGIELL